MEAGPWVDGYTDLLGYSNDKKRHIIIKVHPRGMTLINDNNQFLEIHMSLSELSEIKQLIGNVTK